MLEICSSPLTWVTAKKAICIPSSKLTINNRTCEKITAIADGTNSHMVVLPSERAAKVSCNRKEKKAARHKDLGPESLISKTFNKCPARFRTINWITYKI